MSPWTVPSVRSTRDPHLGKVTLFDEDRGLGTITADDGSLLSFHCTSIVGGQRRIAEGARVTFAAVPGHLGVLEAVGVTLVTLSAQSTGWQGGERTVSSG
jgi:cold shock CspA family protein